MNYVSGHLRRYFATVRSGIIALRKFARGPYNFHPLSIATWNGNVAVWLDSVFNLESKWRRLIIVVICK